MLEGAALGQTTQSKTSLGIEVDDPESRTPDPACGQGSPELDREAPHHREDS